MQVRIREVFERLIAEYRTPQGFDVPVSVKLLSANAPLREG
jgi:hypothetical protein